ncbi:MAG: glycosyltransferase [Methanobacteriota archaeon]|nr:MAG: glycosyltransferase [Euryarchaeota archaeon]
MTATIGDGKEHILVAGPPYRGYLGMIANAFKACGLRASVLEWEYPNRNLLGEYWFYASSSYRSKLAKAQDRLNTSAIEKAVEDLEPDRVLVMKNAVLSQKTRRLCDDRGTRLALWAYDNVRQYPRIAEAAADYDLTFTYEPDDVRLLAETGPAKYLPMAYDPNLYFPASGAESKEFDVCFIGDLRDTPVRKDTLRLVAKDLSDGTVGVWTDAVHWYSHRRLKDLRFRMGRKSLRFTAETVGHEDINRIYSHSKVCLNIHHPQSVGALNPRSFEILGSGGLLLTDKKMEGLTGLQEGESYVRYSSGEGLMERLHGLLDDEEGRHAIAKAGHSAALRGHTYEHRAREILDSLG